MSLESNAQSIPSTDTWMVLNNSDSSSVEGSDTFLKGPPPVTKSWDLVPLKFFLCCHIFVLNNLHFLAIKVK
jgi:hypothetical protein